MLNNNEKSKFIDDIMLSSFEADSISFKCNGCGDCCKHRGDIFLSPPDVYYICRYLKISVDTFMDTYATRNGIELCIKDKGDTERTCAFYGTQIGCLIHPIKPKTCYMYPFIEFDPQKYRVQKTRCVSDSELTSVQAKKIGTIIANNSCRYEPEKEILARYFKLFDDFENKIHKKGIDIEDAENFFLNMFIFNINLKMDESNFFYWFEKQIIIVEDALVML